MKPTAGIVALVSLLTANCGGAYQGRRAEEPEKRCQDVDIVQPLLVGNFSYFVPGTIVHCDLTGDGKLDLLDIQHTLGDLLCQGGIYTRDLPSEFVQGCTLPDAEWERISQQLGYKSAVVTTPETSKRSAL